MFNLVNKNSVSGKSDILLIYNRFNLDNITKPNLKKGEIVMKVKKPNTAVITGDTNGISIDKALLTINEVAEILSVSKFTVYRMIKDGDIQATKVRGSVRVFGKSLEEEISGSLIAA